MRFSRLIVTRATLVLTLAALGPAGAQVAGTETVGGFDGGAVVTITLTDVAGAVIARPAAGTPFRIQVALADPASDRPLTDEHLNGWIRPVEATNGQCRDAARANTLAGDNLARGTTDLGRSLYGVRHQDGTVSIVDWEHSLASANILAMVRTPDATGPITALSDDFAFALATGDGARLRIDAAAGTQPRPLTGFATQAPIISTPNGWMAQGTRLIAPDGQDITLP
ncbi:MAG: hypothetical protein L0G27_09695, partial [Paracoccus sp. (in: a-proteobacteria)]|nr:hypothetical protein [Paracoccus sp. (in: a-proteobacteria)]